MVAKKVEIITKSYKKTSAAKWVCDGSPEYSLTKSDKKERGTEIILHIDKDSLEFLEESRIKTLLDKYNKFMPIPIKFGMKDETCHFQKMLKKTLSQKQLKLTIL